MCIYVRVCTSATASDIAPHIEAMMNILILPLIAVTKQFIFIVKKSGYFHAIHISTNGLIRCSFLTRVIFRKLITPMCKQYSGLNIKEWYIWFMYLLKNYKLYHEVFCYIYISNIWWNFVISSGMLEKRYETEIQVSHANEILISATTDWRDIRQRYTYVHYDFGQEMASHRWPL